MLLKQKENLVVAIIFLIGLIALTINVINNFELLDFAYLLFMIGCFIRFIYIKVR